MIAPNRSDVLAFLRRVAASPVPLTEQPSATDAERATADAAVAAGLACGVRLVDGYAHQLTNAGRARIAAADALALLTEAPNAMQVRGTE